MTPFKSEYDKFQEFWNVSNGERTFRCDREEDAEWLLSVLNPWKEVVKDGLPTIWGDYIVSTGQWVGSCHYDGKFYDYSVNKMKQSSRYELPVTHWMPLPDKP